MTHENMVQYKPVRTLATILFLPIAAMAARVVIASNFMNVIVR